MKSISVILLLLSVIFLGYVVYGQITKKPTYQPPTSNMPIEPAKQIEPIKSAPSETTLVPPAESVPQPSPEPEIEQIPQQNKGDYEQQIDAYRI